MADATLQGLGYSSQTARKVARITYRQLDHWTRTGLVQASVESATGSGSRRRYSFADLLRLQLAASFRRAGLSLQKVREALAAADAAGDQLADIMLASDGQSIYVGHDTTVLVDLLRGGQVVLGIALEPARAALREDLDKMQAGPEAV